jgi:hypothetical protein
VWCRRAVEKRGRCLRTTYVRHIVCTSKKPGVWAPRGHYAVNGSSRDKPIKLSIMAIAGCCNSLIGIHPLPSIRPSTLPNHRNTLPFLRTPLVSCAYTTQPLQLHLQSGFFRSVYFFGRTFSICRLQRSDDSNHTPHSLQNVFGLFKRRPLHPCAITLHGIKART